MDVSVILCTHNPRTEYLRRVLGALAAQSLSKERWEFLLIDNGSESHLGTEWDLSWHPKARHVREEELGLASARRRGIIESRADLLIFVDDDNLLSASYLDQALQIDVAFPRLGSWGGGSISPEFERSPPPHLKPFISHLALRDNTKRFWSNDINSHESIPVGAGLCVRRQVALSYLDFCAQSDVKITGRKGNSLLGHEEYELCFVGCGIGFGMGVFPDLKITHLIPKERVTDEYFLRLLEGCQTSGLFLNFKWPRTPASHRMVDRFRMKRSFPSSPYSLPNLLTMCKSLVTKRGFDRRAYLASVRGTIKARRAIWEACRAHLYGH
jgi:glycosyltransferase involved in cell wall biosynthesis